MDKSEILILETTKYSKDALNQLIPDGSSIREVFCSVKKVTRSEWATAAQQGLRAVYCLGVWPDEYEGETVAVFNGTRLEIYRTYQADEEELELYLGQKVGV